jgi:ankyrin
VSEVPPQPDSLAGALHLDLPLKAEPEDHFPAIEEPSTERQLPPPSHAALPAPATPPLPAPVPAAGSPSVASAPALCLAALSGALVELRALLAQGSPALSALDGHGRGALHYCAMGDQALCIGALLSAGAQLEAQDGSGFTPLALAAQLGSTRATAAFLAAGADADAAAPPSGHTPLMTAVLNGCTECAALLAPASALQARSALGVTALHVAVFAANATCFDLLLPLVADVDERTAEGADPATGKAAVAGRTALQIACSRGQEHMAAAMLARGASRTSADARGCTPLHAAALAGQLACLQLLLGPLGEGGGVMISADDVNAPAEHGMTALHFAASAGATVCCAALIAAGARRDAAAAGCKTPLDEARRRHPLNAELLRLLAWPEQH